MYEDNARGKKAQQAAVRASALAEQCRDFLKPLLEVLDRQIDLRLIQTLLRLVIVLLSHRHRNQGMLLSELGGYLLSPEQAPAGTKRISRLLHSPRWSSAELEEFLWVKGEQRQQEVRAEGHTPLLIWDESVLEKPESLKAEGLGPVRSSRAARLKRIKPGYFNPPGGRPVFVPGFHWLQLLIAGPQGTPTVCHMHWWTSRGPRASGKRAEEEELLRQVAERWGDQVIHVWDRGFAGSPWLQTAFVHAVRFVLRWPKSYRLLDEQGCLRKAWEINRGKRSWDHRQLYDACRRCYRTVGVVAFPVQDPVSEQPLWLVVSRPGSGMSPWYLLTNEPVLNTDDAWRIILSYARRWQIEMSLRYQKSELAFESSRLYSWEARTKLLLIATLVHAFLLSLFTPFCPDTIHWLLHCWCHRTGERSRETSTPLYRLRLAISRLWLAHPPPCLAL